MEIEVNRTAHADQRHYAAYRDINAAGNHYKAHPAGGNDQRRLGIQNVKKGLRLQKPFPWKTIAPIYMAKNTTIVIVSSRLVSVIFFNLSPKPPPAFGVLFDDAILTDLLYMPFRLYLLPDAGEPFSYDRRAQNN